MGGAAAAGGVEPVPISGDRFCAGGAGEPRERPRRGNSFTGAARDRGRGSRELGQLEEQRLRSRRFLSNSRRNERCVGVLEGGCVVTAGVKEGVMTSGTFVWFCWAEQARGI